jgi:lipoprotein-releasing system permease protein
MSLVSHISGRFLRAPGSRLLSLITVFAGLGIILGVMVLDVTLAVMNGFKDQVQLTFVENMPMVTVLKRGGFTGESDSMTARLAEDPEVLGAAPFWREEVLITFQRIGGREKTQTSVLWGIDPVRQPSVTRLDELALPAFEGFDTSAYLGGGPEVPGILLGARLAEQLGVFVGDKVAVHLPRKSGTGVLDYEAETGEFILVGTVESGMFDFDQTFSWAELSTIQEILGVGDTIMGVGLRVRDMNDAPQIAERLEDELGYPKYWATDWISMNVELFKWMQYEKILMFLLLTFLIVIASLNVVALLVMMVRDRRREIGILMSLGAPRTQIAGIFLRLGFTISLAGTLAGTLLGFIVTLLLDRIGYELPGDVLFVEVLPVHAKATDFLLVAGVTLALSAIVSLLPAWLATRQSPVEVLRHE